MVVPESDDEVTAVRTAGGFVFTAVLLLVAFTASWFAQFGVGLPPGAGHRRADAYRVIWPQEWSFFTGLNRNAVTGYRVRGAEWESLPGNRSWDGAMWGVSRVGDAETNEVRQVARLVPDRYWTSCDRELAVRCDGAVGTEEVFRLSNPAPSPLVCGRMVVAVERAMPDGHRRAYLIAVVDVTCGA